MKASVTTRTTLRRIMALLTVMAAFMFQARLGGLGQLTDHAPAPTGVHGQREPGETGRPPAPPEMSGHHHHHEQPVPSPPPAPHAHHPAGPPDAPRPPEPSTHQHSAHCPFCITNAFALEAGLAGLPAGPPDFLPAPPPFLHAVFLPTPRAPQARAPPLPG